MSAKASPTPNVQNMDCNHNNGLDDNLHAMNAPIYNKNLEGHQLMSDENIDTRYIDYEEDGNDNSESQSAKKKKFEAFMMTGDRMINLAKTPANNDFRPKYCKASIEPIPLLEDECASVPSSPPPVLSPECEVEREHNISKKINEMSFEAGFSEPMNESGSDSNVTVKLRAQPQRNRSAVR